MKPAAIVLAGAAILAATGVSPAAGQTFKTYGCADGTQFIVAQPLPRFVVFFAATLLDLAVFMGLYVLLDMGDFGSRPYAPMLRQAAANAVVGVVTFQLVEFLPGAVERRRAARPRLRR